VKIKLLVSLLTGRNSNAYLIMAHRPTVNDSENKNVGVITSRFVALVSGVRHPTCSSIPPVTSQPGTGSGTACTRPRPVVFDVKARPV